MRPTLPALLFLVACPALAEVNVHLGAAFVSSKNLGYVSTYPGAKVEVAGNVGAFAYRARGAYYQSEKLETGDGHGYRLGFMAGWQSDRFAVLGGLGYREQVTSAWTKQGTPALVEFQIRNRRGSFALGAEYLSDSDDTQTVLSAEFRALVKFPVFVRVEHVDYQTLFAAGTGQRVEIGAFWRVGK